jgi:RHS repeat-associated protein
VDGVTTNYTYDDAGQLTSEGVVAQTYDANGNLLTRGADTFTWDYADRLTEATVSGETTSFEYDADSVRVEKTAGTEVTEFLWDRESGLPLLVDDGDDSYLHLDGILAEVDDQGDATYLLADGLGSIRGLADDAGDPAGSASYDVFGGTRAGTGASSAFGYSGEQWDSETGFGFLRARYLIPELGRFLSGDKVQPNAPGTQGFNLYGYVANNPTTWIDPSGQVVMLLLTAQLIEIFLYIALIFALIHLQMSWGSSGYGSDLGSGSLEGVFQGGLDALLDAAEELPLAPDLTGGSSKVEEGTEDPPDTPPVTNTDSGGQTITPAGPGGSSNLPDLPPRTYNCGEIVEWLLSEGWYRVPGQTPEGTLRFGKEGSTYEVQIRLKPYRQSGPRWGLRDLDTGRPVPGPLGHIEPLDTQGCV